MGDQQQFQKMRSGSGFNVALDQSGGSTRKALQLYGIGADAYADDDEMFALMHAFRRRIITRPSFGGNRILGVILFEDTMNQQIAGHTSADYLWSVKAVIPFVKVDKGLAAEVNGVQIMKPIPALDELLARAQEHGIFGAKMRSVIRLASPGRHQGGGRIVFAIAGADPEVRKELDRFGVTERIDADHVFESVEEARAAFDTA